VSVGEVLAARVLVRPLKARFPGHRVFVSTTTLTGNTIARETVRGADGVFFAPFDFPGSVDRVLDRLRPALLVLVETEIWPNLIHRARQRGARVAIVNGRISPRSFPRYRRLRPLLRRVLAEIDLFLMQGEAHRERMLAMGAPPDRVHVAGNLKYDALGEPETPAALRRALGQDGSAPRPLWVAGSTVEGEEAAVLLAFAALRKSDASARLVIAPRHPERFAVVADLVARAGLACARRTLLPEAGWTGGDVLVLDTLGELAQVYALATVVFVGGSLAPAGGHNVLEPAAAGCPVLVGPHLESCQAEADLLRAAGALDVVADADALATRLAGLLADDGLRRAMGGRAREAVARLRGAADADVRLLAEAGLLVARTLADAGG
jgi:3-deoxy-D-manno-octulosonic-acid transferase